MVKMIEKTPADCRSDEIMIDQVKQALSQNGDTTVLPTDILERFVEIMEDKIELAEVDKQKAIEDQKLVMQDLIGLAYENERFAILQANEDLRQKESLKKIAELIGRVANGEVVNLSLKNLLATDKID